MALADRVLPEHIKRAGVLENKLCEYMKNRKVLLRQCDKTMNVGEIKTARELKELCDKQTEEAAAVEKELVELYMKKQRRDQYLRSDERKNVIEAADYLEPLGGNSAVVEQIRKNA